MTEERHRPDRRECLVDVGELTLCVERDEERVGIPMLCLAGLGMQLSAWPAGFIDELRCAGFDPITFDHRDVGRSSYFDEAGMPDLLRALRGEEARLAYRLSDLADDADRLLEVLGIKEANLLGVSMGASVAQLVALRHRSRALSLVSMMGTTGARGIGRASNAALAVLLQPPARNEEEAVAQRVAQVEVLRGSATAADVAGEMEWARDLYRRANHPSGTARQLAALLATPDRTGALATLDLPTLVIHGEHDQMVDLSGGRATAAAIPGADLWIVPGMGHDLPAPYWGELARRIAANAATAAHG